MTDTRYHRHTTPSSKVKSSDHPHLNPTNKVNQKHLMVIEGKEDRDRHQAQCHKKRLQPKPLLTNNLSPVTPWSPDSELAPQGCRRTQPECLCIQASSIFLLSLSHLSTPHPPPSPFLHPSLSLASIVRLKKIRDTDRKFAFFALFSLLHVK